MAPALAATSCCACRSRSGRCSRTGGKTYDSRFGIRQTGTGPYADMLARRFAVAMKRLGLDKARENGGLDCTQFAVPGVDQRQLELL
jgi:hypothetical protein